MGRIQKSADFINAYIQNYSFYKDGQWCYEDGCVLKGSFDIYTITKERQFYDFVFHYFDQLIRSNGDIPTYKLDDFNIDNIQPGYTLVSLYQENPLKKFKIALDTLYSQLQSHPRTQSGNFWHKKSYPHQVWLDGLYMGQPFYMRYDTLWTGKRHYYDITGQIRNVNSFMRDEKSGLYYHGYDEARLKRWAHPKTGVSPCFWGRAMGWYVMSLVDILEAMSETVFEDYRYLELLLREAMKSILSFQDDKTQLWYQVIDQKSREGNYIEVSSSLMFSYTLMKGVRLGYLPEVYFSYGQESFNSVVDLFLKDEQLENICVMAGLGRIDDTYPYRDGSFDYYISEPIVQNDGKGVGIFMMAYAEILRNLNTGQEKLT